MQKNVSHGTPSSIKNLKSHTKLHNVKAPSITFPFTIYLTLIDNISLFLLCSIFSKAYEDLPTIAIKMAVACSSKLQYCVSWIAQMNSTGNASVQICQWSMCQCFPTDSPAFSQIYKSHQIVSFQDDQHICKYSPIKFIICRLTTYSL